MFAYLCFKCSTVLILICALQHEDHTGGCFMQGGT